MSRVDKSKSAVVIAEVQWPKFAIQLMNVLSKLWFSYWLYYGWAKDQSHPLLADHELLIKEKRIKCLEDICMKYKT